tara:strand:+ start:17812 stop:18693 length:882 start_codon:yes stop_codon:yes gene_type:complete
MKRDLTGSGLTNRGNDAMRPVYPTGQFGLLLLTPAADYEVCLDVAATRALAEAANHPGFAETFASDFKVVKQDLHKLKKGYAGAVSLRSSLPQGHLPVMVAHFPSIGFQVKAVGGSRPLPWFQVDVDLLVNRSNISQDWRPFVDYIVTQHPELEDSEPYLREWGFNAEALEPIAMSATIFNYDARRKNGLSDFTFGSLILTADSAAEADRAHALEGGDSSRLFEYKEHVEYRGPAQSPDSQRPINPFAPNESAERKGKTPRRRPKRASDCDEATSQQPPLKSAGSLRLVWSAP